MKEEELKKSKDEVFEKMSSHNLILLLKSTLEKTISKEEANLKLNIGMVPKETIIVFKEIIGSFDSRGLVDESQVKTL